jgi:hypothetical protein
MVILTAYLRHPRIKALILTIPIPFTIAALAVGDPIDATNITALLLLLSYYHLVRVLHYSFSLHIILSIVIGASFYCVMGMTFANIIPPSDLVFWSATIVVFLLNVLFHKILSDKQEPSNRSHLSLTIKLPLTVIMVFGIILLKNSLQGFMTFFPMVGVFATYETRKSLWTNCRQIPIMAMMLIPMLIIIRLTQHNLGFAYGLLCGWVYLLSILIPYSIMMWRKTGVIEL